MSVIDLIVITIALFAFAVAGIFGYYIIDQWNTEAAESLPAEAQTITQIGLTSFSTIDYIFVFLTFGSMLAVIILAFRIDTHPIMFAISMIVLAVIVFIVPHIANAFLEISGSTVFASTMTQFPLMTLIWQNFPLIIFLFGILLSIVIYGKMRSDYG